MRRAGYFIEFIAAMHIGFLTPEYVRPGKAEGGLANYLYKVGRALVSRGHRVSIIVLSERDAVWRDGDVQVHEVRKRQFPKVMMQGGLSSLVSSLIQRYWCLQRLAQRVWVVHRNNPLDVIQASSYIATGYTVRHNGRVPVVCRVSSYTPLWRSASNQQRGVRDTIMDWLEVRQVIDADAAFVPSEFIANTYVRLEGYHPAVIRTPLDEVPIGMDTSFYLEEVAACPYILYFGTLNQIKGVDLLGPILSSVLKRHAKLNFIFIGRDEGFSGGQKIFEYLQSESGDYKDRIRYYPPITKTKLYPVIENAMGVVMPSRVDNYPNACLEAQMLGVPVVGTWKSSLDEMVTDGETGFLAQNGSPSSIEGAIENLLSLGSDERVRMRDNILTYVESMRNEDRIGQLLDFYQQTIDIFR
ncbi:MAG: glycosyltransferase family 4 protein [Anaerolineales bacterium]|nr:glycosyltransferase family 4 protein [Anaerolineales bacterium]